mmetsp:Transcript_48022/g.55427  ORF Transcript_48022/g.55427 Transcript_48022/m.55427 type:complete len:95 (-) Transcript_48022:702-986(-)
MTRHPTIVGMDVQEQTRMRMTLVSGDTRLYLVKYEEEEVFDAVAAATGVSKIEHEIQYRHDQCNKQMRNGTVSSSSTTTTTTATATTKISENGY